jgi:hypothetical protein
MAKNTGTGAGREDRIIKEMGADKAGKQPVNGNGEEKTDETSAKYESWTDESLRVRAMNLGIPNYQTLTNEELIAEIRERERGE